MIDETGQIASGKLIFSSKAWEQLLGRSAHQLVKTDLEILRYLEQRLLFLRLTLGFGWCLEGSKPLPSDQEIMAMHSRKRRRLDVFKTGIGGSSTETQTPATVGPKEAAEAKLTKDELEKEGVGDVGRLCIWCVKM